MTIPMRGRSNHLYFTENGAPPLSDAVAQAIAERLVASGREGGPRRPPPATSEERQARIDAVREKLKERGQGELHAVNRRAVPPKSPEKV